LTEIDIIATIVLIVGGFFGGYIIGKIWPLV